MAKLTLDQATVIIDATLMLAIHQNLRPLAVAVLDEGGHLLAFKRQEGRSGALLPHIAIGKAYGAIGMGRSSRYLAEMAKDRPQFVSSVVDVSPQGMILAPGGVVIKSADGDVIGAVGVSGDTSDTDEAVAVAGVQAAGLVAVV